MTPGFSAHGSTKLAVVVAVMVAKPAHAGRLGFVASFRRDVHVLIRGDEVVEPPGVGRVGVVDLALRIFREHGETGKLANRVGLAIEVVHRVVVRKLLVGERDTEVAAEVGVPVGNPRERPSHARRGTARSSRSAPSKP